MKWLAFFVLAIVLISLAVADGEIWEEDDHEVVIRSERGTKNREKSKCILKLRNENFFFVVIFCIID